MSLGFYVDVQRCIGCRTCQVACKDRHNLQAAGPRTRRVGSFECGMYPEVGMFHLTVSCNHCDDPACVAGCPTGAMFKSDDGTVQHVDDCCVVCRNCMITCPMRAIEFGDVDELRAKHGDAVSELPVLPSAATTQPNLLLHASPEAQRSDFNEVVL